MTSWRNKVEAMDKIIAELILTFLFSTLMSVYGFSAAAQPIQQKTHGSNSPAAYTQKGNITITINELVEIRKAIQELIDSSGKEKDIEISKLKERIAKIHQTELRVLPHEADAWADQFLATLPLRKDRVVTQEKEEEVRFQKERLSIPILFEYSIKKFDEYIIALKKRDKNIVLKQEEMPQIVPSAGSPRHYDTLRIASFPNGTELIVKLNSGSAANGHLVYPALYVWLKKHGEDKPMLFLEQVKYINRPNALAYGNGELTDQFKEQLARAYDVMIEEAYLRSSESPARNIKTVP